MLGRPYLPCLLLMLLVTAATPAAAKFGINRARSIAKTPNVLKTLDVEEPGLSSPSSSSSLADQTQLDFEGEFHHLKEFSVAAPSDATVEQFLNFLSHPTHRNQLLKGGDHPMEKLPVTPELVQEWKAQSAAVKSMYQPNDNDEHHEDSILAIHTTVPLLPGLSIGAVSVLGCKILQCPQTSFPIYECTLIKESYLPQGPKAMVWIFNKIAGGGKSSAEDDDLHKTMTANRKTLSLCRVSIEPHNEDGNDNNMQSPATTTSSETTTPGGIFRLRYFGRVSVSCNIPRHLLKMLPLSKERIEAKVSRSIVQQLEREALQSMHKFQTAMEDWFSGPR